MCPQTCIAQTLPPWPHVLLNLVVCHSRRESKCPVESEPSIQFVMSTERHLAVTAGHSAGKWDMRNLQVTCRVHLSKGSLMKWFRAVVIHSRCLVDIGNPPIHGPQQLVIWFSSLCTPAQMEIYMEEEEKEKRGAPGIKHTRQFSITSVSHSLP